MRSANRMPLIVATLALLAACASTKPPVELAGGVVISYETEGVPFCSPCNVVKFTVASDGRVWLEQTQCAAFYKNCTVRRRQLSVSQDQFSTFHKELEPFRPKGTLNLLGPDPALCKEWTNDLAGVRISWREGSEASQLLYNFGCDPASHTAMLEAVRSAPDALAIKGPAVF